MAVIGQLLTLAVLLQGAYTSRLSLAEYPELSLIECDVPFGPDPTPEDIEFRLYTRSSDEYTRLKTNHKDSISSLKPFSHLLVVIHGFQEDVDTAKWMHDIKNLYLKKEDMNIILLQWKKLADLPIPLYGRAAHHTQFVGTELARLIKWLEDTTDFSASETHIIGFSLGGQVAGAAGYHLDNLSRITGLDPAGPCFTGKPPSERLDESDAYFVDVIHTNAVGYTGGLGFFKPYGHVDFYMNGGYIQKGCEILSSIEDPIEPLQRPSLCSHRRAPEYYIESLNSNEPNYGYQCADQTTFEDGECLFNKNNTVGYGVTPKPEGVFYSNTMADKTPPYLARSILIQLVVGAEDSIFPTHGKAFFGAYNDIFLTDAVNIMSNYYGVGSGTILTKLISIRSSNSGNSMQIWGKYTRTFSLPGTDLVAQKIEAYDAHDKEWYCVSGPVVMEHGHQYDFFPQKGRCEGRRSFVH